MSVYLYMKNTLLFLQRYIFCTLHDKLKSKKASGNNIGPLTPIFVSGIWSWVCLVSFSGQGAADQGEGAQSSAAVRTHSGGTLAAAGGAEAERGAPQNCSGGEEEAAARGGQGQLI